MSRQCTDFIDEYEHIDDESLEYVLENVLSDAAHNDNDIDSTALREEYNSVLMNFCQCRQQTDSDGMCCRDCSHGSNYILSTASNHSELVLIMETKQDIIYECSMECSCDKKQCLNRLVQRGPRKHLKISFSEKVKSKGLITTADIPCGAFICEYAGELLTRNEAQQRIADNEKLFKMNYIICLNEMPQQNADSSKIYRTFVDPTYRGNIGRYLNHSCDPNCEIFSVRVDCPIPKICIFSKRFIKAGEELCFHYGGEERTCKTLLKLSNKKPCLCSSSNCTKFLPNIEF